MLGTMTNASQFLASSVESGEFVIQLIAISGGLFIAMLWMILKSTRVVTIKREAERTKREIAAYVAEGSIAPEDAATLINAGSDTEIEKITAAVASGVISPAKAEKLIASLRSNRQAAAN